MGIKLYVCLLTPVITAFSRHFGDIDFEGSVIIFILPVSEKRQLMQIPTLELIYIEASVFTAHIWFLQECCGHDHCFILLKIFKNAPVPRDKPKNLS